MIKIRKDMTKSFDIEKILRFDIEGGILQKKIEVSHMVINNKDKKDKKIKMAGSCISKAKQCQSIYDHNNCFKIH